MYIPRKRIGSVAMMIKTWYKDNKAVYYGDQRLIIFCLKLLKCLYKTNQMYYYFPKPLKYVYKTGSMSSMRLDRAVLFFFVIYLTLLCCIEYHILGHTVLSYHIYPYKCPRPIYHPPPPPIYLCKVHISGFYIPLNRQHLCDSGIPKKMRFSTSPIKYRFFFTRNKEIPYK